jgi:uncharacterized membrane protein
MLTIRRTILLLVLITLASLAISLWAAPRLPAVVPSHWNTAGQVNGYAPRAVALWLMPFVILFTGLLILFIPLIDPLRQNVDAFRPALHAVVALLAVFLTYIHTLTLLAGMGVSFNMTYRLLPAFCGLLVALGFLTERAKPNWFIGIRTPWTLSSPTVWAKTHRLGGLVFKVCGLLVLLGLFFPPETGMLFTLIPISAAALVTVVYSYVIYQNERKQ